MITQKYINEICYKIVGCAIEVHRELGPGLLESVYEKVLIKELKGKGLNVKSQLEIPIIYKGENIESNLRVDILVEDFVIVELKSVEGLLPIFKAQLLTYLKLTDKPKGILINFNTTNIVKNTIHLVTEKFSKLPKEKIILCVLASLR